MVTETGGLCGGRWGGRRGHPPSILRKFSVKVPGKRWLVLGSARLCWPLGYGKRVAVPPQGPALSWLGLQGDWSACHLPKPSVLAWGLEGLDCVSQPSPDWPVHPPGGGGSGSAPEGQLARSVLSLSLSNTNHSYRLPLGVWPAHRPLVPGSLCRGQAGLLLGEGLGVYAHKPRPPPWS